MTEARYIKLTNMIRKRIIDSIERDLVAVEEIGNDADRHVVLNEMVSILRSVKQRII